MHRDISRRNPLLLQNALPTGDGTAREKKVRNDHEKRLLSVLLTLCMVLCLVPATAFAATQSVDSWSGLQDLMNSTNDLSVTLSSDISWGGSSLTVPAGKTVTLDLNGKAIDAQSNGTAIVVNGTLTIKNSGDDLAGPIGNGAGPITGNIKNGKADDKEAGGILVAGGGKLVMNSGWLTNCGDNSVKSTAAGGIYVSQNAEFEMNGGIITSCTGRDILCAAGVVNYGTFTMSGNATISGSKTTTGGDGVAICNVGTLNANGGTVQTGQSCTNNATIQNTGGSATVFYCNVLNTGFGTIKGGTYSYPVENAGTIAGGTFNGTVSNTRIVTGGTFNGATTGIYTVTFDSGVSSQIRANCPATAPDAPNREGYTFDGWFKDGTSYDFTENVTENISLTANWTAKSYTVRFDTNGGSTVQAQNVAYGGKAQEPAVPTKPGCTFAGWHLNGEAYNFTSPVTEDLTITAQWTVNRYTISFNTDGGSEVAPITQDYGTAVTAPADPTREGYTFTSWDKAIPATMPAENLTITAQWTANRYTISFNTDGGSEVAPITQDYGTAIAAPADPTREGYTFMGWNPAIPATMPAENLTITAQWTVNRYTITYDTDGGSDIGHITQDYGTAVTAPAVPTKPGYTFMGWDKEIPATMPAENLTITAQWTANRYTISFNTDGGSAVAPITQDYGTAVAAPADPTREGYTFTGWDKAIPATMPAENLTVTAQWTVNRYTITFDTDGGSEVAPITQDYGTAITAPANPTNNGYTFIGWEPELPATMPAKVMTVTAQWTLDRYTISYNLNNGTATGNPDSYTVESDAITLNTPTRPGYTFTGWSGTGLTGENNLTVTIEKGSTGNRSYTAHWRYNTGGGSGYSYYTIEATAGAGGSISPSGNVSVREGGDQTFTITPDKGYAVSTVKIDGKSIGAVKSYTFENVSRTHTIEVIFVKGTASASTGDSSNLPLWSALLLASTITLAGAVHYKRKRAR